MPTSAPYWTAGVYGVLAALTILLGGGLVGQTRRLAEASRNALAAVGAGFLVALGLLGALPEAVEHADGALVPLLLAAGSLAAMLLVHRFGHGHARGHSGEHGHAHGHAHPAAHAEHTPVGHAPDDAPELSAHDTRLAIAGLTLHSLLDGVAVGAALATHRELGVLLHKVPEGATAAALTYAGGGETRIAKRNVAIVAAASLIGSAAVFTAGPTLSYALAVTAGVTSGVGIGIATHLLRRDASKALAGVVGGALIFALSEWLLHR